MKKLGYWKIHLGWWCGNWGRRWRFKNERWKNQESDDEFEIDQEENKIDDKDTAINNCWVAPTLFHTKN